MFCTNRETKTQSYRGDSSVTVYGIVFDTKTVILGGMCFSLIVCIRWYIKTFVEKIRWLESRQEVLESALEDCRINLSRLYSRYSDNYKERERLRKKEERRLAELVTGSEDLLLGSKRKYTEL